jgi:hypothetical protein
MVSFHEEDMKVGFLKVLAIGGQKKSELTVSSTGRRSPSKASSVTTTVPGGRPIPPHVPILNKKRTLIILTLHMLNLSFIVRLINGKFLHICIL